MGFEKTYKNWTSHGEEYVSVRDTRDRDRWDNDSIGIDMDVRNSMRQKVQEGLGIPNMN